MSRQHEPPPGSGKSGRLKQNEGSIFRGAGTNIVLAGGCSGNTAPYRYDFRTCNGYSDDWASSISVLLLRVSMLFMRRKGFAGFQSQHLEQFMRNQSETSLMISRKSGGTYGWFW